jgi:DNA-binding NarL/FixJ family response regulator
MATKPISIDVVDDQPAQRKAVKQLLAHIVPSAVIAEYTGYSDALRGLAHYLPELLIVEIAIHEGNGMEFVRKLRLQYPSIRMLVYTRQDEQLYAERALRVGAHGYLMRPAVPDLFAEAVHTVLRGDLYVSPAIEDHILRHIAGQAEDRPDDPELVLSNRELEIFVKIGEGLTSREIAEQLTLSVKTVETHRAHIKRKLQIHAAHELQQRATDWVAQSQSVH